MSVPTKLDSQIASQPDEMTRLLASNKTAEQVGAAAAALAGCRRLWLVGTGTSQHAAILGTGMLESAGITAQAVSSQKFAVWPPRMEPTDGVIVITHTGETSYALAARASASRAGLPCFTVTKSGTDMDGVIETVPHETSETYTVSYTAALLVLGLLARQLSGGRWGSDITDVPSHVADALESPDVDGVPVPDRLLVYTGSGPAAVTASEGALKVREAARFTSEGFESEYLLHGSAVPLGPRDHLIALTGYDTDGFVSLLVDAARSESVPVTEVGSDGSIDPLLAQIPLTVKLQRIASRFAAERGYDPDTVITGDWLGERLWETGAP